MGRRDLRREIEALRSQVAELSTQRRDRGNAKATDESDERVAEEEGTPHKDLVDFSGLQPHVEELFHSLASELKEIPTQAAVVIFALGVLMGRFMCR